MKFNPTFSQSLSVVMITFLSIVIATSCKKSSGEAKPSSDNTTTQQKLNVTNDAIDASSSDEENFDMVMGTGDYADVSNSIAGAKGTGRIITYSPSKDVYPHTKTIDYGSGWTDGKGVKRSGKIIITYYDAAEDAEGKYSLTTYDNFYVDGVHIEGSAQVNKIKNGSDQDVYLHIIHRTITDDQGDVKDFNSNAKWTLIDWNGGTKNAYEISEHTTGNETYDGIESNNFKTDVDEDSPVIKPLNYNKRVQGGLISNIHLSHVEHGDPNQLDEYLDYGNGDYDNIGTLSINGGEPQTVSLPLRFWPLNL